MTNPRFKSYVRTQLDLSGGGDVVITDDNVAKVLKMYAEAETSAKLNEKQLRGFKKALAEMDIDDKTKFALKSKIETKIDNGEFRSMQEIEKYVNKDLGAENIDKGLQRRFFGDGVQNDLQQRMELRADETYKDFLNANLDNIQGLLDKRKEILSDARLEKNDREKLATSFARQINLLQEQQKATQERFKAIGKAGFISQREIQQMVEQYGEEEALKRIEKIQIRKPGVREKPTEVQFKNRINDALNKMVLGETADFTTQDMKLLDKIAKREEQLTRYKYELKYIREKGGTEGRAFANKYKFSADWDRDAEEKIKKEFNRVRKEKGGWDNYYEGFLNEIKNPSVDWVRKNIDLIPTKEREKFFLSPKGKSEIKLYGKVKEMPMPRERTFGPPVKGEKSVQTTLEEISEPKRDLVNDERKSDDEDWRSFLEDANRRSGKRYTFGGR